MKYTVNIDYLGSSPFTLNLYCKGYHRKVGFYEQRELELDQEFILRELKLFLSTIENLPANPLFLNYKI